MYVPIVANSKYAIHQQTDTVIFTLTPTSSSDNPFYQKLVRLLIPAAAASVAAARAT